MAQTPFTQIAQVLAQADGGGAVAARHLDLAKAILQALREPSAAMTVSGAEVIRNVRETESEAAFESDAANTWRFMIDAAIDEGREPA